MTPAYLLREYKSLSYYSGVLTAFCMVAIIIVCSYDCIVIKANRANGHQPTIKLFDMEAFPLFLGQSIVLFEGNITLLNLYSEHREPRKMYTSTI